MCSQASCRALPGLVTPTLGCIQAHSTNPNPTTQPGIPSPRKKRYCIGFYFATYSFSLWRVFTNPRPSQSVVPYLLQVHHQNPNPKTPNWIRNYLGKRLLALAVLQTPQLAAHSFHVTRIFIKRSYHPDNLN